MKNKFRLQNKFKNKRLKVAEYSQMDKLRKTLLRDIDEIQKKSIQRINSKEGYFLLKFKNI